MDWSDKAQAYNIDETCSRYHSQSTEAHFHPHSTAFEERWARWPPLDRVQGRVRGRGCVGPAGLQAGQGGPGLTAAPHTPQRLHAGVLGQVHPGQPAPGRAGAPGLGRPACACGLHPEGRVGGPAAAVRRRGPGLWAALRGAGGCPPQAAGPPAEGGERSPGGHPSARVGWGASPGLTWFCCRRCGRSQPRSTTSGRCDRPSRTRRRRCAWPRRGCTSARTGPGWSCAGTLPSSGAPLLGLHLSMPPPASPAGPSSRSHPTGGGGLREEAAHVFLALQRGLPNYVGCGPLPAQGRPRPSPS